MPVFDNLERASFDGIEFPVKSVHIRCVQKTHLHKYLRVPGAIIEKLERDPYMIDMEVPFQATIRGYGDLWPSRAALMRERFERGTTSTLVVPTIGSILAMTTEWDETADMGRIRSGTNARLPFLEDATQVFLSNALVKVQRSSLQSANERFALVLDDFLNIPDADRSVFDDVQDISNSVLAFKDQGDLYGGLLGAKVAQLINICNQADRQIQAFQDPENYTLLDAFHDLWDAGITLGKNLAESPQGPRLYTTPREMSLTEVAAATQALGGEDDAARIMLNNALADPFSVAAGTPIIYFTG